MQNPQIMEDIESVDFKLYKTCLQIEKTQLAREIPFWLIGEFHWTICLGNSVVCDSKCSKSNLKTVSMSWDKLFRVLLHMCTNVADTNKWTCKDILIFHLF